MSTPSVRIILRVDQQTGAVTRAGAAGACPVKLDEGRGIGPINGETKTLGEIVQSYTAAVEFETVRDSFGVDLQEAIGEVLYAELDGATALRGRGGWLEIAVDDPKSLRRRHLERLPWAFLARPNPGGSPFLLHDKWVVTLDGDPTGQNRRDVLFPPEPRMLLIFAGLREDDEAAAHEQELRDCLRPYYTTPLSFDANVRICRSWGEVEAGLVQNLDVVYFYGHGAADDANGTALKFRDDYDVSATQLQALFAAMPLNVRPTVFFANCCHGTSAARFGFGETLSSLVACLIANRTVAVPGEARALGRFVLESLARDGSSPEIFLPDAMALVMRKIAGIAYGGRWACPVVYTNYATWTSLAPERRHIVRRATAGDFPERVDRTQALIATTDALRATLAAPGVVIHCVVWQAEEQDGLVALGRRIRDTLSETFTTKAVRDVIVRLQADAIPRATEDRDLYPHFAKSLLMSLAPRRRELLQHDTAIELLNVAEEIDDHIAQGGGSILVRHEAVAAEPQAFLRAYWGAWKLLQRMIASRGEPDRNLRIVLALPLKIGPTVRIDPAALFKPAPGRMELTTLGVLGPVSAGELRAHLGDFSQFYEIVDDDDADSISRKIHAATAGVFEQTYLSLKVRAKIT